MNAIRCRRLFSLASKRPNSVNDPDSLLYSLESRKVADGYATPEGTKSFSLRNRKINQANWRSPFCEQLTLSRLGYGSYIGDPTAEHDKKMVDSLLECVRSGAVNVIDTAINYRYMKSERSIGTALQRLFAEGYGREEFFISSKGGFISKDGDRSNFSEDNLLKLLDSGAIADSDIQGNAHCMHPNYLDNQLELSLFNLQLSTMDLYYIHNPAESQLALIGQEAFESKIKDAFKMLEEKKKENKIRYYGIATWNCFRSPTDETGIHVSLERMVQLAEEVAGGKGHGFKFIQLPMNGLMLEALGAQWQPIDSELYEADTLAIANKHGINPNQLPPKSKDPKTNVSILRAARMLGINIMTSSSLMQGSVVKHSLDKKYFDCDHNSARHLLFLRSIPGDTSVISNLVGMKSLDHVHSNIEVTTKADVDPRTFWKFVQEYSQDQKAVTD